jgi:hypothetical protein
MTANSNPLRRADMKRTLMMTAAALVLASGTGVASAQPAPGGDAQQEQGMDMTHHRQDLRQQRQEMRQQRRQMMRQDRRDDETTSRDDEDDRVSEDRQDRSDMMGPGGRRHRDRGQPGMRSGMMGSPMGGHGMMGSPMGGLGMMEGGMMRPGMLRMVMILVDTDGDGTISLQEFQAAHERIFRAMDANRDGRLTLEELQAFMQTMGMPAPQRRR